MKLIPRLFMAMMLLSISVACHAQIKNAITETVKIYGNCGACETNIEKAGNQKKIAKVDWDKVTKMATLTYDATKTTRDEILKRIALAGYDSDEFLAPAEAYAELSGCCQYERTNLTVAKMEGMEKMEDMVMIPPISNPSTTTEVEPQEEMPEMKMGSNSELHEVVEMVENKPAETAPKPGVDSSTKTVEVAKNKPMEANPKMDMSPKKEPAKVTTSPVANQPKNQLFTVFDTYFAVKNGLVNGNGEIVSVKAKNLAAAIGAIKMESLKNEEMAVWMKAMKPLAADAKLMANTKNTVEQRKYFITLSANMYPLMKAVKTEAPVYYQFCPMANDGKGANWLSKESVIKNPYYGLQMLGCGKTVETIKK